MKENKTQMPVQVILLMHLLDNLSQKHAFFNQLPPQKMGKTLRGQSSYAKETEPWPSASKQARPAQ